MRQLGVLLLVSAVLTGSLYGQSTSGSIGGTIEDPTRALLPGVKVTATNVGTGVAASTLSNESGAFGSFGTTTRRSRFPKGATMRAYAWYDNSANNGFNPKPNATVFYGDQTWEELHFPSYGLVLNDLSIDPRTVVRNPGPGGRGN